MRVVSVSEMQEMDRKAIEELGIPSIRLMENAGRSVSDAAIDMLKGTSQAKVAIFCGTGNNGGDGFVAARHLVKHGIELDIYLLGERSCVKRDPGINLSRLKEMGVKVQGLQLKDGQALQLKKSKVRPQLFIDAIFGIGLKGEVKEPLKSVITSLNRGDIPILSIDVPSGLDADTGEVLGEAIKAKKTITMQCAKRGFYINKGPAHVGELIVADIGIPEGLCAG